MTVSPLTSRYVPHHNKLSSRGGRPVTRVIQHHWAGLLGGDARLMSPTAQASSNYIIYSTGEIVAQVPEEFRAWTSGSFEADAGSITFEVQNSSGPVHGNDDDPSSWQISDKALDACIRLLADIAKRYNWGGVSHANYCGHREFFQTSCPGGYIWHRREEIRAAAHSIVTGRKVIPAQVSPTPPVEGKTVWQLADEVLAGLHGNGEQRQKSLGSQYAAVQAEINRRLSPKSNAVKSKSIAQLADEVLAGVHGNGDERRKKLGAQYGPVQAEINRRLGSTTGGRGTPNIAQLADAVMRGQYGTGAARKKKLGSNYAAVQAEVNRRLAVTKAPAKKQKTTAQLADEVLAGQHGNGEERKKSLGNRYNAVQAEINRRLGA